MDARKLRELAERCRRLAKACNDATTAGHLESLAGEYIERARRLETADGKSDAALETADRDPSL